MTNISTDLKRALRNAVLASGVLLCGATAWAGNIPQYKLSQGTEKYAEFTDGTPITCTFTNGTVVVFPNGYEAKNSYTGQGFPIGFDFRFAGTTVNQFAVSNTGVLYLGNGEVSNEDTKSFRLGMSLIKAGLYKGDFSYKTTGEAGSRVFTLQIKNAIVNESGSDKGKYALQVRLHEADGRIEYAFKEIDTVYTTGSGFDTGLHGWDAEDALQLTSKDLKSTPTISPKLKCDILEPDSYIGWDSNDYDKFYQVVYVLTPESDTNAPANAPTGLTLSQEEDNLVIKATKGDGAAATVVLVSEQPFTHGDMPEDEKTFPVGATIGNAKVLYYGNSSELNLRYSGIEPGKRYYVRAISANGYPAFNIDNVAEATFVSSQAAPSSLQVAAKNATTLNVGCTAEDNVIIAKATQCVPGYDKGYVGLIGTPEATAQVGDAIPGGGEVAYVGKAGRFTLDVEPNEMTYLRAWTVKEGLLSSTSMDAYGIASPSFPFAPDLESWPVGCKLEGGWTATKEQYIPYTRAYEGDIAVRAVSVENNVVTLQTPALDLTLPTTLTFEYAMETVRPPLVEGAVSTPMGNEAGKFGETGAMTISVNGTVYSTVTEYPGKMAACPDGFESGSSTFVPVSVEIPACGSEQTLSLTFHTEGTSYLYIRNFKVEQVAVPIGAPLFLTVVPNEENGTLAVTAQRHEGATSTLLMVSEGQFNGELEHGRTYSAGETVGNATVFYHDTHSNIVTETHPLESGKQYTVTAASADAAGQWHNEFATAMAVSTGVEVLATDSEGNFEIYTSTGLRLKGVSISELAPGLYIINGKKTIVY